MGKRETTALLLILLVICICFFSSQDQHHPATPARASTSGGAGALATPDTAITGKPTISAAFIDQTLCAAKSPACHTGQALYSYGVKYGIDPAYALAFFQHESQYGKYGIAATNRDLGNIRCSAGYTCLNGFRCYQTWQSSYEDWYQLIRYYIDSLHKSTIRAILYTYAPPVENSTEGYINAVCSAVNTWRARADA
jgi:hypothetical protein